MRPLLLTSAIVLCLVPNAHGDQTADDRKKLQGAWNVVSGEKSGTAVTEEKIKEARIQLVISGDNFTLKTARDPKGFTGTIKLDATKSPRQIDMTFGADKKVAIGVYELEGDTLKICYGQERPNEFKTKPKVDQRLHVYKREKQ